MDQIQALFPELCNYFDLCVCVHAESSLTLCDTLDCSPPGSSVHGIFWVKILKWVAFFFFSPEDLPDPRIETMTPELQEDSLSA